MTNHTSLHSSSLAPTGSGSEIADRSTSLAPGRRLGGLTAVIVAAGLVVSGCTGGPGDREDFIDVLTRDDTFTTNEAECITDAVFDRYSEDGDAMQMISAAESYEFLTGEGGVEGFDGFFTETVSGCTTIGPSE